MVIICPNCEGLQPMKVVASSGHRIYARCRAGHNRVVTFDSSGWRPEMATTLCDDECDCPQCKGDD